MIINTELKFIFVHVPKTAGNAVEVSLPKCDKSHIGEKHILLQDVNKEGMFAFGFVRNPWDRMCSLYHFRCQKDNQNNKFDQQRLRDFGFEKCLLTGILGENLPPWDTPSLDMTNDAMTWLHGCNAIGRFEKLQEDFDVICKMANLGKITLPHTNSSNHDDYKSYYTQEMIDFVAEKHKRTIELFDYSF